MEQRVIRDRGTTDRKSRAEAWVTEKEQGQDNQVGLLSCDDLASQTIAFEPRILWVLKSSINNGISICRIQVALL